MKKRLFDYTPPFCSFLFDIQANRKEMIHAFNIMGGEIPFTP